MDDESTYTPGADKTLFMLVSCCSFINYLVCLSLGMRSLENWCY